MGHADLDEIRIFLRSSKGNISQGKFEFIERRKCLQTLIELEMTIDDVESVILSLQPSDYVKGPENDRDPTMSGDIYVFGKNHASIDLYIKIEKRLQSRMCLYIVS